MSLPKSFPAKVNLNANLFLSEAKKLSTRAGFGDRLAELGGSDQDIVVLTGDLTESTKVDKFAAKFPKRFIQVGVAEQNLAGIAAGLGLSGKKAVMASYAVFSPGRNWDQIRVGICYSKANVKIVGGHAGLATGPDGATHQALEDIAMMNALPNLVILEPSDYFEAKKAIEEALKIEGPVYIRTFRENTQALTTEKTPFQVGKAQVWMEGEDITIISAGPVIYEALLAAKNVNAQRGIKCEVINSPSIKPFDEKTIIESARKTGKVVVVHEHQINGGLGSVVAVALAKHCPVPIAFVGIQDTFGESGKYHELKDKYGLSAKHIEKAILNLVE